MGIWDFVQSGTPRIFNGGKSLQYGSGVMNLGYQPQVEDDGQATAGAIKAGGSGLGALAGALLSLRTKKKEKKIASIKHEMKRKSYLDAVNQNILEEGEGDREFAHGLQDLNSEHGAAGLANSSARDYAQKTAQHGQDMRNWALRKQRADLRYGWEKGEQIGQLQKAIDRINQQNAMISAAIDTASSVAQMGVMCDKNVKREFGSVDPQEILARVMELPISTWRYEWEKKNVRHLGPMAQDWHDKLGFGNHHDGKMIDFVDAFGVAITAVQGLADLVARQNMRIRKLEDTIKIRGKDASR